MFDFWSYDFMRYAFLSALILGPTCALLGVFVTLRGMSFFSDALAHSAVTGVALGFLVHEQWHWQVDPFVSVLAFSFLLASGMAWLFHKTTLKPDTVIAFAFTGSVAFGVVVISKLGKYRLLDGCLFGSIYANGPADLWHQGALAVVVVGLLAWQSRAYTLSTLSPDLAHVQGLRTGWLNYVFALLIAATVTVCLKMLGALLLSALIVIPPAAAKLVAQSFRQMVICSILIGLFAAGTGVIASYHWDVPTGPCIVLTDVACLLLCYTLHALRKTA